MKFGTTPKVGCADGMFLLKSSLQSRIEMDIDARAIFVDLVKVHDSMKHDVSSLYLKNGSSGSTCEIGGNVSWRF